MIQELGNAMLTMLLAKFMLNDVPHAAMSAQDEPPTPRQLRYIAVLCQRLHISTPYEEHVRTRGEAGRLIRRLQVEEKYRGGR